MRINVKKVLLQAAEDRLKPRPASKIRKVSGAKQPSTGISPVNSTSSPADLLSMLQHEFCGVKKSRDMLSSQIARMVEKQRLAEALAPEDQALQEKHRDERRALYHRIEAYRNELAAHYDNIAYVKIHGHLPQKREPPSTEETIFSLRDHKRSLINRRDKLRRRIQIMATKDATKVPSLQLQLEQLDAEYDDVQARIKQLEGKV